MSPKDIRSTRIKVLCAGELSPGDFIHPTKASSFGGLVTAVEDCPMSITNDYQIFVANRVTPYLAASIDKFNVTQGVAEVGIEKSH